MTPTEIAGLLLAVFFLFVGIVIVAVGAYIAGGLAVLLAGFLAVTVYRSMEDD